MGIGRSPRLDDVVAAVRRLADGRLCSTVPMQFAVAAALTGDRSHQVSFRAALKERAAITFERLYAIPGVTCVAPTAAFYAMPKIALPPGRTDQDYVLALLRATGVLCVYGSGFGLPAADGFLRIVFLASPGELRHHLRSDGRLHERISAGLAFPRAMISDKSSHVGWSRPSSPWLAAAVLVVTLYAARDALMLIYVSALIAMGFSPLVRFIERPNSAKRRRRMPRPLAILRHLSHCHRRVRPRGAAGRAAARRAGDRALGRLPQHFDDLQQFLIRYRLLTRRMTLQEAVRKRAGRQRAATPSTRSWSPSRASSAACSASSRR